jgi:hypothetical protein
MPLLLALIQSTPKLSWKKLILHNGKNYHGTKISAFAATPRNLVMNITSVDNIVIVHTGQTSFE